ncbi:MAG: GMC family oxidoreductase [Acidobacteriota bacterium]
MMRCGNEWDAVIIGSGAGGGPLALSLARAGLQVLVLEKGPRYRREDYRREDRHREDRHREDGRREDGRPENQQPEGRRQGCRREDSQRPAPDPAEIAPGAQARSVGLREEDFFPDVETDPHTVVTPKTVRPLRTALGWGAVCVGGGTVHMGGYFYRFHPDDFRMRERFGAVEELADWPYSYAELEPYYCRAEQEVGVSGLGGETPFEGPRSEPYPMPPLGAHPVANKVREACWGRGMHPFPTPRAVNSRPRHGRPACDYCTTCAGLGCPMGARGTSQEAFIDRAEATGNCEVRPNCQVARILLDAQGRAAGCVYFDAGGREVEVLGKIVCVCCAAIESARLLLLSRCDRFPRGLANGSGRVGKHLQFHAVSMGVGRLEGAVPSDHPFVGVSVLDHYFLPPEIGQLAKGGVIRYTRVPELEPLHLSFEIFHDFLPNARTFVELDDEVTDAFGLPVARIHLDRPEHHVEAGEWLLDRAFEVLVDLGAEELMATDIGGTSSYLVQGTCRAGLDPKTSVLDSYCQTHEVPNLFVVDGSFMPTSGGAPPTLTIIANSLRTADSILARWTGGELR